jgi:hypothetical protein
VLASLCCVFNTLHDKKSSKSRARNRRAAMRRVPDATKRVGQPNLFRNSERTSTP